MLHRRRLPSPAPRIVRGRLHGRRLFASGAVAFVLSLGLLGETKALPPPAQATARDHGAPVRRGGRELLVVDGGLPFAVELARGARPSVEALVLDPGADGVLQITAALRGRRDIAAVHLVSHGAPGRVFLGASELSIASFARYRESLAAWFGELAAFERRPDLLIYGCSAGAGAEGARFLGALAEVTGADVAGSDDLTGATSRGGDLELEVARGAIEARLPFERALAERVVGTLEAFTVTNLDDAGAGSLRDAIAAANAHPGLDAIVFDLALSADGGGAPLEITLTTGEITIEEGVDVVGPGAEVLTIDGNHESRIFVVDAQGAGEVTLDGLTLANGSCTTGCAVYNDDSVVTISSSVLTRNEASIGGAAVTTVGILGDLAETNLLDSQVTANVGAESGAVTFDEHTSGAVARSTISENEAGFGAGLFAQTSEVYIRDSLFAENHSSHWSLGGAVAEDWAQLQIVNTTISGNTATLGTAGLALSGGLSELDNVTVAANTSSADRNGSVSASPAGGISLTWNANALRARSPVR